MGHQNFSIQLHSASDIQADNRAVIMKPLFQPDRLSCLELGKFSRRVFTWVAKTT